MAAKARPITKERDFTKRANTNVMNTKHIITNKTCLYIISQDYPTQT